jgi:phosphoethanolamine N-methyltransferase
MTHTEENGTLDTGQYSPKEIAKYEAVYGRNFVSPGGLVTAQEFAALLHLKPGMQVLDVGCGLGGSAFYMAQHYGVQVHGIDLSTNMLALAQARCGEMGLAGQVSLVHADILAFTAPILYDRIYSRDVFLHIHDKARLLQVLNACLAPGGQLLFTDYCCGAGEKSPAFAAYVHKRQYDLRTLAEYQHLLAQAGFTAIQAEDRTAQFIHILQAELANLPVDRFDALTLAELSQSWQDKIQRAQAGEQRWGLFMGKRAV